MKVRLKIYLTFLFAAIIGVLFFYFSQHTKQLVDTNVLFIKKITTIEKLELQMNDEVLKGSFFLYQNYDRTKEVSQKIDKNLADLKSDFALAGEHSRTTALLHDYELSQEAKEKDIQKFSTLNSIVKNSTNYIPSLILQNNDAIRSAGSEYLKEILHVTSSIFLIRSSYDSDLQNRITASLMNINSKQNLPESVLPFNKAFLAHVGIYQKYFNEYSQTLERILNRDTTTILEKVKESFIEEHEAEVDRFTVTALFFLFSFLVAIGFVVYFLINTDKENRKLLALQKELQEAATSDSLTKLPNRFSFLQEHRTRFEHPMMLLVNIDGFKHINDFYGTKVGDYVLKEFAGFLLTVVKHNIDARVYRLGADDFGILLEDRPEVNVTELTKTIIRSVESENIRYQNYEISVRVAVGIAREEPLIEKADMVLKHIKSSSRMKFMEYREELNLYENIHKNLQYLSVLKGAIDRDDIIPYFQPIYNNITGLREKYECLARIIDENGNVLSPIGFLEAAKQSKFYGEITKIMILKSFVAFSCYEYDFSINLSIEDIVDEEINDFIFEMLDNFEGIGERVIFEILESEGISNYEAVASFMRKIKREYNCKFALDDFGAGHSNFEHVLRLDFDYLKIDSSLIRNIDTDKNCEIIVETIVSFAQRIGNKKLTAEFVHSKEVFEKVKALGIHYSQGYHLGKPDPDIT